MNDFFPGLKEVNNDLITVLISHEYSIFLDAVGICLANHGCKIVGKVNTAKEVVAMYSDLLPDVVVIGVEFSGKMIGLDTAKEVLNNHPNAKVVFLSQSGEADLIRKAYKIGAHAFVNKLCDSNDLYKAVRLAKCGQLYFMPGAAELLVITLLREKPEELSPIAALDQREVEIFLLMAQGFTNEEIAEKFELSKRTISQSSQNIKEKLHLHRPAELTRLAIRLSLIEP